MSVTKRPNLLYILSDQHSPFVAGCFGDALVATPHLDRLAARGVAFDNVYCPSPLCVPSRMSMLTGRFPFQNRVWTNDHILDSGIPTFATALGAAGYRPVLIGRMHSVGPDQLRGYAERLVGDHGPNFVGGTDPGRGVLEGTAGPARVSLERSGAGQSGYQVHDEYVTAAAIDFLNRHALALKSKQTNEPFCVTVGFMLPHQPFVARKEDYDLYAGRMTRPTHLAPFDETIHPHFRRWRQQTGIEEVTEEETLRARTAYWGLVTAMDRMIGSILDALQANDLAKDTLVVYSSDHGEQVGEHGLWWKQTFYEQSVRVPTIAAWPGILPEGRRCGRVASSLDLMATMLAALGAPPLPTSNGRNMLELWRQPEESRGWIDEAFSEYCTDDGCLQRMVRRDQWKFNYYHGMEPQLFDLSADPGEVHDLAQDPRYRTIRERLTARVLASWNPDVIAGQLAERRAESALIKTWTRKTRPADQYRWKLTAEMNYLD